MSFAACIPIILRSEGGFVDDPIDPGGATNFGITEDILSRWVGRPVTPTEVRALDAATASAIYQAWFYGPAHGPDLPAGVDLVVFDAAVNSGVAEAITLLQRAVGAAVDGHFGPETLAAVRAQDAVTTIRAFRDAHAAFYEGRSTFWKYGNGWLARNARTASLAEGMAK